MVLIVSKVWYNTRSDMARVTRKGGFLMPPQEERLSALEQTVPVLRKGIQDLNYNATILLGVTSEQGKDIREMKVSLAVLNEHLGAFEQNVNTRFETLEHRFGTLEQSVNSRFETQDKKFDQILLLLNMLISKPGQET